MLRESHPSAFVKYEKDNIIRDYVTEPVLQEIAVLIRGKSKKMDLLPEFWRHDLIPVSAMSDFGMRAQHYIFDIVATERGGYLTMESLLQKHPYLVWQVPESLYRHSLSSYKPDQRVMHALEEALEKPHLWGDNKQDAQPVMDAIWAALDGQDVDKLAVYNTLRLIGAGSHDVVSQNSTRMFTILGRDEWRRRTDTVKRLLGQGADGDG